MLAMVDHNYRIGYHMLVEADAANLQELLDIAREDPDHHIFTNFSVVCEDDGLQSRVHVFNGASAEEIDLQRDLFDTSDP